ncbi:MAG TPA: ABC transporter permease [Luteolibacter sp.]|nr:ABC transporter permease [Luteolibacter sp.]
MRSSIPTNRHRWLHARDLVIALVGRDLKVLYKRSSLGFGWALVTPLLQLFIFTFVFRRVLSMNIENYASFVFIGVLAFGWFQSALGQSSGLITGNKALVTQPGFPLSLLPHVTVGVRLFHFVIAMPVLFGLLWFQGMRPGLSWLSLPLLVAVQYLIIAGIAYPLASINVIFRDTQHITMVLLQLAMFVTPVFYSLDLVPEYLRPWYYLNPMAGIIQSWRTVLMHNQWPDPGLLAVLAGAGLILMILGRRLFVAQSHRFVEEI